MKQLVKNQRGAIAALVVVTILMFIIILMGTYTAITNLRKSQLESDIRIQQLYGGDVERIEEVYNTVIKSITAGLEVGDYIKYDTGIEGVGVITCRVLYPADSEYGLQIISDKSVETITLGSDTDFEVAKASYNDMIENLNDKAEGYINTNYVTDARCVGSIPTVENGVFVSKDSETLGPIELGFEYNGSTSIDCKGTDENYEIDREQMSSEGLWTTGEDYWLASRQVVRPDSSRCDFYAWYVNTNGYLYSSYLCNVNNLGNAYSSAKSHGFRPCFLLKTDIKILGGDGKSEETAYEN